MASFICKLIEGDPAYAHHVIAEDDETIAFLSGYPTLPGYALVCPRAHVEDLADGLTTEAYLVLQNAFTASHAPCAKSSMLNASTCSRSAANRATATCIFTSCLCRRAFHTSSSSITP